jgi:4-amino-4-deoxychorismate lyase
MEEIKYFETVKCDDFEVFNLDYHNKRIANTIGLNLNLQEYVYPVSSELLRCKVIYDKDGIIDIQYFPYEKREIKTFKLIYDNEVSYSKKYFDRNTLNELFEKRENSDEIIIIKNKIVTDTSIANIAIYYENTWITSKNCLLRGTVRDRLIDDKFLIERDITTKMLKKASKIALMNAMIGFDIMENYSFKE